MSMTFTRRYWRILHLCENTANNEWYDNFLSFLSKILKKCMFDKKKASRHCWRYSTDKHHKPFEFIYLIDLAIKIATISKRKLLNFKVNLQAQHKIRSHSLV